MPQDYFGERIAQTYEAKWPELFDPAVIDPAVGFLADLAGSGAVLELGIGTGRIALPLSRRVVRVHGIDLSPAMVARLRAAPGAERVPVTIGDFAAARVNGTFSLVYLVRNTITNLTTQEEQVACFRNAAAHLTPGGCFVIENYIPALRRLPPGQTVYPFAVTTGHFGFEEYDFAAQIAWSRHYWMTDGQFESRSTPHRYLWPAELDLMAQLAGMTLSGRWADWQRAPYTGDSENHISVWRRDG